MKKKTFVVLIALALIFSALAISINAEESTETNNDLMNFFCFWNDNETATCYIFNSSLKGIVTIPYENITFYNQ